MNFLVENLGEIYLLHLKNKCSVVVFDRFFVRMATLSI